MRIVNVCVPSINLSEILILMFVILFIQLLISITNFIVPNKAQHVNIARLSLRFVKFQIIYTWSFSFCLFVCLFICLFVVVVVVVVVVIVVLVFF